MDHSPAIPRIRRRTRGPAGFTLLELLLALMVSVTIAAALATTLYTAFRARSSAEETGRLDKELVRLSIVYESELDRRLRMLVALAEPLLLVGMAGLIGMVVLGMLLPIFNLQDLIK